MQQLHYSALRSNLYLRRPLKQGSCITLSEDKRVSMTETKAIQNLTDDTFVCQYKISL